MKKLFLALLIIAFLFIVYKAVLSITAGIIGAMDREQEGINEPQFITENKLGGKQ